MITPLPPKQYKIINAEFIIPPPLPNRQAMDRDELQSLADSIKARGLINPIKVRPIGDKYEIVAGHRRYCACLLIGKINIECIVETQTDEEAEADKAHENLYRADLNPLEEALLIARLVNHKEENIPQVMGIVKQSRQWVLDRMEILDYPEYFWPAIESKIVSLGVAKFLFKIKDDAYRKMFFESAVNNGMKVWQAETCLRQWEAGVLTPSNIVIPDASEKNPNPTPVFTVDCVRCNKPAFNPNLQNVFIHKVCPESDNGNGQTPI